MRVLLTGSSGYVGSALRYRLESLGHEVVGVDLVGQAEFVGDLRLLSFVQTLPEVDLIIHLAAVQYFSKLPLFNRAEYLLSSNSQMATGLTQRYLSGVPIIACGSSMQFSGIVSRNMSPGSFRDNGPYAKSKNVSHAILSGFFENVLWICPPVVLDAARGGIVRSLAKISKALGISLSVKGGARGVPVIHRSDLVELIVSRVDSVDNEIICVSTVSNLSFTEVSEAARGSGYSVGLRVPLWALSLFARITRYLVVSKEQLHLIEVEQTVPIIDAESFGFSPTSQGSLLSELRGLT